MVGESIWNEERNPMFVKTLLPAARERLITIRDNALLTEAAKLLGDRHTNLVVVCNDGGAMVGVVTKTDIVRCISRCHGSGCTAAVATVMTQDVTACGPDDLLQDIWSIMKERSLLHIPVVDQDLKPLSVAI
jgi:CBS domain-containing protein